MKNKPLVSIITPCYNAGNVISETIESVLQQSYQNWEMLICDDCSTDNSVEIIKEYCEKDSRIKLFSTPQNTGAPAEPRNIAINNAKGDFIAFLDADDIWFSNKLEVQISFAIKKGYNLVYSNYEKISWEGERNNRFIIVAENTSYDKMLKTCDIPFLTALLKKDILKNVRFMTMPKEDYAFWLEVLKPGIVAYNTNSVLALYRESKNSRSGNKIKMISGQWNILRKEEKISFFKAFYYMIIFMIKGYLKYIK